jgi:hypothetical protein
MNEDITNLEELPEIMEEFLGRTVYISELLPGVATELYADNYNPLALLTHYTNHCYSIQGVLHHFNAGEDTTFYAFGAYDIDNNKHLGATDWVNLCELLGIQTVPIITINESPLFNIQDKLSIGRWQELCRELQPQLEAFHGYNGYVHKGIVIRPVVECKSFLIEEHGWLIDPPLVVKVINENYPTQGTPV